VHVKLTEALGREQTAIMALVALRLADRGDLANEILAHKIIELAKAGECDPERLCEGIMKEFRAARPVPTTPASEPSSS
jgi:hypothetical protein